MSLRKKVLAHEKDAELPTWSTQYHTLKITSKFVIKQAIISKYILKYSQEDYILNYNYSCTFKPHANFTLTAIRNEMVFPTVPRADLTVWSIHYIPYKKKKKQISQTSS